MLWLEARIINISTSSLNKVETKPFRSFALHKEINFQPKWKIDQFIPSQISQSLLISYELSEHELPQESAP